MIINNDSLTIVSRSDGSYIKGIYTQGTIQGFIIMRCSVQPTTGNDLEFLPEGERLKVRFTAYLSNNITLSQHDTAIYEDVEYKIIFNQQWVTNIDHNKLFLALM